MERRCDNCEWWTRIPKGTGWWIFAYSDIGGFCHESPPRMALFRKRETLEHEWCRHFKPKGEQE